jgi:succinate dehydrogenase / fumarate reductase membrane anchor subunit
MEVPTVRRPKASGRLEVYAWFFMRVSGLLLILMVLTHFAVMHLYYGVDKINFEVVALRYRTPFWRLYDLVLVVLALAHGLNGARMILDDYVHPRNWRVAVLCVVWTFGLAILAMGVFTILTFRG